MANKNLTKKEATFCQLYSVLGHPHEAAIAAGYADHDANQIFADLLAKAPVWEECLRLDKELPTQAVAGLKRIAFGGINDVVRLLDTEEGISQEELKYLDLFCVSEIKRNSKGALEVKLYDRFKALQALLAQDNRRQEHKQKEELDAEPSFYDALLASTSQVNAGGIGED